VASLPDIVIIAGPTASGKTAIGIELAQRLNGEVLSADARQIYRYMDIGTAKPTARERAAARHHLIDFIEPDGHYSAGQFAEDAGRVIGDLQGRGKLPIVVGGAGLYMRALIDGFSPMPEVPKHIRTRLLAEADDHLDALYARLCDIDPEWASKINSSDRQRIIRGLEVYEASGKPLSDHQKLPAEPLGNWTSAWFGLLWDRDRLYDRINKRAVQMFDGGLVDEVIALSEKGFTPELNALNTFGYRDVFLYLNGKLTGEEALADLQKGTRRYAKRQMTWFRRENRMQWIDPCTGSPAKAIVERLKSA